MRPRRRAHQRRRRARAPAAGPRGLHRGRLRQQPRPADHRPGARGPAPADRRRLRPGVLRRRQAGVRRLPGAALRLLRPGGIVAFDNALWHDRVADPAQRDPDTAAISELARAGRGRTSGWCRCCSRSATACWPRSSGRLTGAAPRQPAVSQRSSSRVPKPVAPLVISPSSRRRPGRTRDVEVGPGPPAGELAQEQRGASIDPAPARLPCGDVGQVGDWRSRAPRR